jgi:dynein heavy chain
LKEVAMHFLKEGHMVDRTERISNVCVGLHTSVQDETVVYALETGKYYYVTPLSYMKLLSTFERIFERKKEVTEEQRYTYLNGVKMLDECGVAVANMAKELE